MHTSDKHNYLKSTFRTLLSFFPKYVAILFLMGLLGISFLILSYCIPVNPVLKESSLSETDLMGWAPLVNNRYTQYESFFTSFEPGALDDNTDAIILNNSFDESEGSILKRAADMNNYGRYWHGYVSVLRPIFYFMDYWDYLLVNSFLQLFLMGCVGYGVFKVTSKKRYLLAFFSSCAFLTPAATGMSLQYSPIFYISMLGSLFCLLKTDWILQKNRRYYLFLLLGIITCYFDFLTYPLLSFAFPFCWLVVAAGKKLDLKAQFQLLFGGGFSFLFGFGGFFVTKWLIQAVICGKEILYDGIANVSIHLKDTQENYMLLHQHYCRIDTLYNNFRHYFFPLFVFIICAWIGTFVYKYLRGTLQVKSDQLIFTAITLTSPAWYFILNTHTTYHHLFTYRIYSASLLGFMLFICGCMTDDYPLHITLRTFLTKFSLFVFCLLFGFAASKLAKEDLYSLNGGEYTELFLTEADSIEFTFTPSMREIKGFSFCIHTNESTEGEIQITLYDNEKTYETLQIPIEVYKDQSYALQLTDWELTPLKQYTMHVTIKDNPSGIRLLITPEDYKPQVEYGNIFLNHESLGNVAPLSGIVYRGNIQPRSIKLYLSVCCGTFALMWLLSIYTYIKTLRKSY